MTTKLFFDVIDWFIPDYIASSKNSGYLLKSRLVNTIIYAAISTALFLYIQGCFASRFSDNTVYVGGFFSAVAIIFFFCSLNIFKYTGSIKLVTNLFGIGGYLLAMASIFLTGGFNDSPFTPLPLLLPMICGVLCNARIGITWCLTVSFSYMILMLAEMNAYSFPQIYTLDHRQGMVSTIWGVILFFSGFCAYFHFIIRREESKGYISSHTKL